MPVAKLKQLLDQNGVKYISITHSPAYTAQEIAARAAVSGNELAKTVIVKLDGRMAMAVLPASWTVNLARLARVAGAQAAVLASEQEFSARFPKCELGAEPPFGNLYEMEVFVDKTLAADREIAFNAGTHTELIKLAYDDYERIVKPTVADFAGRHR